MIFRQLFDSESSTYTYLLADETTHECLLIDSVYEQAERDIKLIKELKLDLKFLLETHVHADHITGIGKIKEVFPDAKSVISKSSGAELPDIPVIDGDEINLGNIKVKVITTPGHTNGCVSYYTEGKVFTGDAVLIRGCGRTDFQEGCPYTLYSSVTEKIFSLPDSTIIYPAHDYKGQMSSSVAEEKNFNARLAGKTKEEFANIMNNLNLPLPKKIHEAVPVNLKCGKKD